MREKRSYAFIRRMDLLYSAKATTKKVRQVSDLCHKHLQLRDSSGFPPDSLLIGVLLQYSKP